MIAVLTINIPLHHSFHNKLGIHSNLRYIIIWFRSNINNRLIFRLINLIFTNKEGLTYTEVMKDDSVDLIKEAGKGLEVTTRVLVEGVDPVEDMQKILQHLPYLLHPIPYLPLLITTLQGYHLYTMQGGGGQGWEPYPTWISHPFQVGLLRSLRVVIEILRLHSFILTHSTM